MFRKKNNPEAIKGDVIGEALVEVRNRIEDFGWTTGGGFRSEVHPMCLGNHIAVVAGKKEGFSAMQQYMLKFCQPWTQIKGSPLAISIVNALGFAYTEHLWYWNDSFWSKRKGKKASLQLINEAIKKRNWFVVYEAHVAAWKENAEREKLYVPAEWKPRTVSGEDREKVTV